MSRRGGGFLLVALLMGVFSIPVSCAHASGPHSMFVPPDKLNNSTMSGPHAHHSHSLPFHSLDLASVEQIQASVAAGEISATIRAWVGIVDPEPVAGVSDLPDTHPFVVATVSMTQASVDVVLKVDEGSLVLPVVEQLEGRSERPLLPPPR